jgi:hypothetical protein
MPETKKTIKDVAEDALFIQNACNLSGVVLAFARAMEVLNEEKHRLNEGSDFVRFHPVTILFVNKLEDMTGSNYSLRFGKAYDMCQALVNGTSDPNAAQRAVLADVQQERSERAQLETTARNRQAIE